jgi:hypothetical protein
MNLVQINERLKSLPMQVIQQYANGMNPEVPPYLALGELQRRELSQKQMANQGGQQGPQPSVKEQVEQKAGLMALQQMQQQQMAQQMQQPRGPMPIPPGAPQPEMQPQPEMMARGGLAGIPVRSDMFEYAGGGIIAFQSGGQSLNERAARQMEEKGSIYDPYFGLPAQERERMKQEAKLKAAQDRSSQSMAVTESNARAMAEGAQARVNELESNRDSLIRQYGARQYEQALAKAKQAIDAASSRGSELMAQQSQMGRSMVAEATPPPRPAAPISRPTEQMTPQQMEARMAPTGLLGAAVDKGIKPPVAPRPTPLMSPRPVAEAPVAPVAAEPQAGLPAALAGAPEFSPTPVSPRIAQVDEMMASQKREAPTAEQIKSDVSALMPAGMQEEAMQKRFAEQRARADARERGYKESQPSGLDNLIRVLGQAGQYKGFSGIGPAYTSMQQQRRAEDLAFQKQQDELMTAIEGREYGADKDVFSTRSTAMDRAQQSFSENQKSILSAAAKMAENEQGRLSEDNKAKMLLDMKKFEASERAREVANKIASEEKIAGMRSSDSRYVADSGNINARQGVEYVNLMAQSRALEEKGDKAGAKRLADRAQDIFNYRGGASGTAGVGAERNDISRKRLQIQTWKDIRDGSSNPAAMEEAEKNILQLARDIAKIESGGGAGGGNAFTVTAGGKTYTFPTQEAANKFKAEAGVK